MVEVEIGGRQLARKTLFAPKMSCVLDANNTILQRALWTLRLVHERFYG